MELFLKKFKQNKPSTLLLASQLDASCKRLAAAEDSLFSSSVGSLDYSIALSEFLLCLNDFESTVSLWSSHAEC